MDANGTNLEELELSGAGDATTYLRTAENMVLQLRSLDPVTATHLAAEIEVLHAQLTKAINSHPTNDEIRNIDRQALSLVERMEREIGQAVTELDEY